MTLPPLVAGSPPSPDPHLGPGQLSPLHKLSPSPFHGNPLWDGNCPLGGGVLGTPLPNSPSVSKPEM